MTPATSSTPHSPPATCCAGGGNVSAVAERTEVTHLTSPAGDAVTLPRPQPAVPRTPRSRPGYPRVIGRDGAVTGKPQQPRCLAALISVLLCLCGSWCM